MGRKNRNKFQIPVKVLLGSIMAVKVGVLQAYFRLFKP